MSRYLIKFKPIEPYFFGSEQTFGEGEDSDYFGKSLKFPQQTTVLGALRERVLIDGKKYRFDGKYGNRDEIDKLIGRQGFRICKDCNNDFGVVKSISPIFICKKEDGNNKYYTMSPYDYGIDVSFSSEIRSNIFLSRDYTPIIKFNNNAGVNKLKDYSFNMLISQDNKDKICINDMIIENEKIGIEKTSKGDSNQDKFYKKKSYLLYKEYSFAVIADIDVPINTGVIYMGADNTKFEMSVSDFDTNYQDLFKDIKSHNSKTVTLLGNAIVDHEILQHCKFVINEFENFRYIKTSTNAYKFEKKKSKEGSGGSKSSLYNILKAGTVIYSDEIEEVEKFFYEPSLQQIGYNIYNKNI